MSDFDQAIVFTDQPHGGISAKALNIAWRDGAISTDFVASKPPVSGVAAGDYLLVLKADGTYAKVPATALGGGTGGGSGPVTTWNETPGGLINGVNKNYTSAHSYVLLAVFLNGVRQRKPDDYVETGSSSFQFVLAPLAGDSLSIDYTQP